MLEACSTRPYFSEEAAAEVRRFLEDPCGWSARHGGVGSTAQPEPGKLWTPESETGGKGGKLWTPD